MGNSDNFLGIDEPWCHPDQAGVYVLPAPYEHTSSYVLGSDRGPSAIIEASQQVELYDETLRYEPYREWGGVATAATLNLDGRSMDRPYSLFKTSCSRMSGWESFSSLSLVSIPARLGAIRAHAQLIRRCVFSKSMPMAISATLTKAISYSHASVMARVVQDGLSLVQVGVRSISPEEIELIEKTPRIKTFFAASILDPSGPYEGRAARWIPDILAACTGPVYLTFDCDGLDASLVPALGTPEPGGLGWYDTLALVTALANGPGIVGMDISEIAPIEGFVAPQFSIARLIYRMLGRIRAGRRVH